MTLNPNLSDKSCSLLFTVQQHKCPNLANFVDKQTLDLITTESGQVMQPNNKDNITQGNILCKEIMTHTRLARNVVQLKANVLCKVLLKSLYPLNYWRKNPWKLTSYF